MSELRKSLGAGAVALGAVACCAGLPLLAAGLSTAALAWVGGIAIGALTLAAGIALAIAKAWRRSCAAPSDRGRARATSGGGP